MTSVAVTGVPSFVHSAGLPLRIGTRNVTVDIAFGGEFYAIADSEAIGIPIDIVECRRARPHGAESRTPLNRRCTSSILSTPS